MKIPARTNSRHHGARSAASPQWPALRYGATRSALLAGASVAVLAAAAAASPAVAGQPTVFSPAWFAARAQGAAAGSSTNSGTGSATAQVQAQARQSVSDLAKMAAAINAAQAFQSLAAATHAGGGVVDGFATTLNALTTLNPNAGLSLLKGVLDDSGALASGNSLWVGAGLPVQTTTGGKTTVTIEQTQSRALLNWQRFDIGAATSLVFDQSKYGGASAYSWVALNKVAADVAPSKILGSITSSGKVFVINQNGIIFGAGSQVNVNALIASAADLPATVTPASGSTPATVTFSIYGAQAGNTFAPSFLNAPVNSTIDVEPGATISTQLPTNPTSRSSYVMLLGGSAINAGSITTPQGQTVLAAGNSFILRQGYGTGGNQTATVLGSQVATTGFVGTAGTPDPAVPAGPAVNRGLITATDGDITLVGHTVQQAGVILASTSVNDRGTVHLLSDTTDGSATITLAPGSVTVVQPDSDSQTTALNSQRSQLITQSASLDLLRIKQADTSNPQVNTVGTLADRLDLSRIEIVTGGSVEFGSGSLTMAQGGQVAVQAAGRVQADSNAALDVSGQLNVLLPMSSNTIAVSVQSFEQRDAPVNRLAGSLDSKTINLDIRDLVLVAASAQYPTDRYYSGGGLLEVSGYLNTTGHSIGEWTSLGGTIALSAAEVVAQTNAQFNLAGGSLSYQAGSLPTTYLVSSSGQLYNANSAPANIAYTGIYGGVTIDHARWNVTNTYVTPLFGPQSVYQPGYTVGRDAGTLTLSAPTVVFEGAISAGVSNGTYQTTARAKSVTDGYAAPQSAVAQGGSLVVGDYNASGLIGSFKTDIVFENAVPALADSLAVGTAIPASRVNTAWFSSAAIDAAGLGGLIVAAGVTKDTGGSIRIVDAITLAPGGTVTLTAPTVDIAGGIVARAGAVTVSNSQTVVGGQPSPLGVAASAALVTLEPGATLDTRGIWTNLRLDPSAAATAAYANAGSVTLDSTGALSLAAGSRIDVSSGGVLLASGKLVNGKGGNVTLIGNDPSLASAGANATVALLGTVTGYGMAGGGALTVVANSVLIAATATAVPVGTLWLAPEFFDAGFGTYDINGLAGLTVADGTTLAPVAPVFEFTSASSDRPTGTDPASVLPLWLPPVYVQDTLHGTMTQRQGVSLFLRSAANAGRSSAEGGNLLLGSGAAITVDPGQSVQLSAYNQVTVNGTVTAPGGSISAINLRQENYLLSESSQYYVGLSVWLGPDSRLDAAARAFVATDTQGRAFGVVPAGGTVTLGSLGGAQSDNAGSVVSTDAQVILRPGAVVTASGTSAVIDPSAGASGQLGRALASGGTPVQVSSNGGTISLSSYTGIYIDGSLTAAAGGAGASGGTLALTLEAPLFSSSAPVSPSYWQRLPRTIRISQATPSQFGSATLAPGDATPLGVRNQARIGVTQIDAGGFANLSLFSRDLILFDGSVNLAVAGTLSFFQGAIAETQTTASVTVAAPYVLLSGATPHTADGVVTGIAVTESAWVPSPKVTQATLDIVASLIEVDNDVRFGAKATIDTGVKGSASIEYVGGPGFANIVLNSAGDIRFGNSTFVTPGSVTFIAAQLYPITNASASVYAGVNYYQGGLHNLYAAGNTLTVEWNGHTATAPYSVNGNITLAAPTIEQDGIIRAPEGQITLGAVYTYPTGAPGNQNSFTSLVELRPGSVTSVSIAGLTVPFGGTGDNQTYSYNGQTVGAITPAIAIEAASVQSDPNATLDISGGGTVAGAVFQTGRGGSTDTLLQPLLNFTGTALAKTTLSANPVYAIVPGFIGGYAPVAPVDLSSSYAGAAPTVGAQITLAASADGLPAGTYTLLPSYYALLPGAYRVEINTTTNKVFAGAQTLPDGSAVVGGYAGNARTGSKAVLAVPVTLTPGSVVRNYSQYSEVTYSQFEQTIAAQTGAPRTAIPADAKQLTLLYPAVPGVAVLPALSYRGVSNFAPASGGYGSTVVIEGATGANTPPDFEVVAPGAAAAPNRVSLSAAELDNLDTARLIIGGGAQVGSVGGAPTLRFAATANSVTVRDGASLTVPELFLVASSLSGSGAISLESGATVDTIGAGAPPYDSTAGYYYNSFGATVLAASNGRLNFTPDGATAQLQQFGPINVASGATLLAGGTLTFATSKGVNLSQTADYGAKYLTINVATINVVSDTAQASMNTLGTAPPTGLNINQTLLNRLLAGDAAHGIPGLVQLTLSASQSMNLIGGVTLDTTRVAGAQLQQLVIDTPAIYGWNDTAAGGAASAAAIQVGTGTLVWNGIATNTGAGNTAGGSQVPGAMPNLGLSSGAGSLNLQGSEILLGYAPGTQSQNQVALDRVIEGFQSVTLTASRDIVAANNGALAVYAAPAASFGAHGTGGNLALVTPLLTGQAGAVLAVSAGGSLTVTGTAAAASTAGGLGAEIDLSGSTITLNTGIQLPGGRFTATAQTGISLKSGATLDLGGQTATFFDQSRDAPGGTAILATAAGDVRQDAGSTIDLSAGHAAAGSLTVLAQAGTADLGGTLIGGAKTGETQGSIEIRAGQIAGFVALNTALTADGVTAARVFEIGSGDLTVGNEIVASSVSLVLDGGALTVSGTINAGGAAPGTIDLVAANGLTLGLGALLEARSTVLHTDSYGQVIDALNTPQVTLTASGGTLTIQGGASIDVRSADGVARGRVALNAPVIGSDDIAIDVTGPVGLSGVWGGSAAAPSGSVAVYGWTRLTPTLDSSGTLSVVTQAWLDQQNTATVAPFIAAAAANTALLARLQPLIDAAGGSAASGGAFHLRPGVEVNSAAGTSMVVSGDLDLSAMRYGGGEPGALVLRSAGNLTVNGSINDGFTAASNSLSNPDDNGWLIFGGGSAEPFGGDIRLPQLLPAPIVLRGSATGTGIPAGRDTTLGYDIHVASLSQSGKLAPAVLNADVVIPAAVTMDPNAPLSIPASGWVATAPIFGPASGGSALLYAAGAEIPGGAVIPGGATLSAGSVMPKAVRLVTGQLWPGTASLGVFNTGTLYLTQNATITGGGLIPSGSTMVFGSKVPGYVLRTTGTDGVQGQIWAAASLMPAGSMSWSIGLVAGANTASADRTAVVPAVGGGAGNIVLSDLHYANITSSSAPTTVTPAFSVIRTGTGELTLKSAGNIVEYSLYGVYTAGAQSATVTADPAQYVAPVQSLDPASGTLTLSSYDSFAVKQVNFPTGGGNVVVAAQGGFYGDIYAGGTESASSDLVGNWLWRAGSGNTGVQAVSSGASLDTAWWINFGTYAYNATDANFAALVGFTGVGALGGGNVSVIVGGNAGVTLARNPTSRSQGLDIAVGSTGLVTHGSTLAETGGGNLTVRIGGTLNGLNEGAASTLSSYDGLNGSFVNTRGTLTVQAGQIGRIVPQYGTPDPVDSRPLDPYAASVALEQGGLVVVPGDSAVQITTLRDLVLAGAGDPGRETMANEPGFVLNGQTAVAGGIASFSLWTPATSIALTSLGGNVTPTTQPLLAGTSSYGNDAPTDFRFVYPATLDVVAMSGNLFYGSVAAVQTNSSYSLELAPAPAGQLEMLARGSVFASGYSFDMSGATPNSAANTSNLPSPFSPMFSADQSLQPSLYTNAQYSFGNYYSLFGFQTDTPTSDIHANDTQPSRIYAATGDIVDFRYGEILNFSASSGISPSTWYLAAKPVWIVAGRDIVAAGNRPSLSPTNANVGANVFAAEQNQVITANSQAVSSGNLILNGRATDISLVSAGRDILQSYFYVAGPGLLEVDAGRNINQQFEGMLKSIGPVYDVSATNRDGGAGISVLAGTGAAGLDLANFEQLYLNPANAYDTSASLTAAANQGKVDQTPLDYDNNTVLTYLDQLNTWLAARYGFAGGTAGALAYFQTLSALEQQVFVRQVFFEELKAAGREEANSASRRYHSYVRGVEAIDALMPWSAAPVSAADLQLNAAGQPSSFQAALNRLAGLPEQAVPVSSAEARSLYAQEVADPNAAFDQAAYQSVVPLALRRSVAAGTGTVYSGSLTMFSNAVVLQGTTAVIDAGIATQYGGDIQVLTPGGQILLGLNGGVQPGSSTGLITFGSGNIAAYAHGSVILGQSRVFTVYGGNIQLWSATGDVNAGIGTKTSVVYQPPSITYDTVADLTLAPTAPTNGAGIATLTSVPGVPAGDVDLAAPQGTIDAGEAGIRVSGNLTLAAAVVSNAANLQVGGKTQGAPVVAVSNVGALQAAAATAGAAQSSASGAADAARRNRQAAEASVISVDVLGMGE